MGVIISKSANGTYIFYISALFLYTIVYIYNYNFILNKKNNKIKHYTNVHYFLSHLRYNYSGWENI